MQKLNKATELVKMKVKQIKNKIIQAFYRGKLQLFKVLPIKRQNLKKLDKI